MKIGPGRWEMVAIPRLHVEQTPVSQVGCCMRVGHVQHEGDGVGHQVVEPYALRGGSTTKKRREVFSMSRGHFMLRRQLIRLEPEGSQSGVNGLVWNGDSPC